jgi:hypothetical protein
VLSTFADRKLFSGPALALAVEQSRVYGPDADAYTPPVLEATDGRPSSCRPPALSFITHR